MEIFYQCYGAEAGLAGLKWLPYGGLYLTGKSRGLCTILHIMHCFHCMIWWNMIYYCIMPYGGLHLSGEWTRLDQIRFGQIGYD